MKKDSKQRLFEVMTRLDKTFKSKLTEGDALKEYGGAPEWEDPSNPDREHDRMIYKKYVQNKEPKIITLKYPAVCKETGKRLNRGEQALYYPQDKSFFCLDSKQAQEWREMKADDQMGGVYEEIGYNNEPRMIKSQSSRPLYVIAREIYQDWRPVHPYAKPYLEAMSSLSSIDDNYIMDSGRSIVAYFLSNANTWKGETAKRIKMELKKMLGLKELESI
jgi:hypothetical protein